PPTHTLTQHTHSHRVNTQHTHSHRVHTLSHTHSITHTPTHTHTYTHTHTHTHTLTHRQPTCLSTRAGGRLPFVNMATRLSGLSGALMSSSYLQTCRVYGRGIVWLFVMVFFCFCFWGLDHAYS